MGKSAKCMRMLQLLASRGRMSREELAAELQTNVRNLVEYRRELEEAGYPVESITGRYGGYHLATEAFFPVLKLNEAEQKALLDAQKYLNAQPDFLLMSEFHSAMDKIRMQMKKTETDNIYMKEQITAVNEDIRAKIRLCEGAISASQAVALEYKGMKDAKAKRIIIHPYEILHYQSAYYCLAYSLSAKDFRIFKFSPERMKKMTLLQRFFTRDHDFDVKDHVGALGLMKGDLHEFEILVTGSQALLVAEKKIGLHPHMYWKDEQTLYLKTMMEGKMNVISFLLSLGDCVEIISPEYLKEEIAGMICKMYEKHIAESPPVL